jgi:toxin ParE1/3/4
MEITWLARARADVSDLRQYIEQRHPDGAQRVALAIYAAVRRIADAPDLGRPGRVAHTRELVVSRTPFIVAYAVIEDTVVVLAVIHGANEWPDAL